MNFVVHWNETAMGLHAFPIPIPPPTSLSTRPLWVFPVHQVRALVSCIQPGLVICFTLDNIHVSMLFSVGEGEGGMFQVVVSYSEMFSPPSWFSPAVTSLSPLLDLPLLANLCMFDCPGLGLAHFPFVHSRSLDDLSLCQGLKYNL